MLRGLRLLGAVAVTVVVVALMPSTSWATTTEPSPTATVTVTESPSPAPTVTETTTATAEPSGPTVDPAAALDQQLTGPELLGLSVGAVIVALLGALVVVNLGGAA